MSLDDPLTRITNLTTPLGEDASGTPMLVLRKLEGKEQLNQLFDYKLTAHSSKPDISPASLIGKTVCVSMQDQYGNLRYLNALVEQFTMLGGDRRRTLYELKLVPWFWLATKSENCEIFQNMTILEIVTKVLGKYSFPIDPRITEKGEQLKFTVQYNESDFSFVSRLLERAGITYFFEHTDQHHTMVLIDYMGYRKVPEHETIPFRAPDSLGISDEETISRWNPQQRIKSGSYWTDDYDYRGPRANIAENSGSTSKQLDFDKHSVYHWQGQGHYNDWNIGKKITSLKQEQQEQGFQSIELDSNVRALALGATGNVFTLVKHPQQEMNQNVLIVSTQTYINESPSTTGDGDPAECRVTLTVASTKYPYRPPLVTPSPRIYGPQSAIVVGPEGAEVYTNDLNEIRIFLLWSQQRTARYASGGEGFSCWVRVITNVAGYGFGGLAIPRVNTEVIVMFLDGNPDYPIVVGSVTNSDRVPAMFSQTGSLPGNQVLTGAKSKEFGGSRYNQWLFDDTTGQIRMQLESEHAKTQLNMGYITHPRNTSATPRGEGFELRSDAWGALRAAKGLLISADAQSGASGNTLSREELAELLRESLDLAKKLGEFAAKNLGNVSDPKPQETLSKAVKDWGHGSNAEHGENGGTPIVGVSAPNGIALGTPKSTTIAAGEHVDVIAAHNQHLTAGKVMNLHAGEGISHFAVKGGINSIAHQGKYIIKAHDDEIQIAADKSLTITSSHDHIALAADQYILLTSGEAYIKLAGGNIQLHCPGTLDMKAGNHNLLGPASMPFALPVMPHSVCKPCLIGASANTSPFAAYGA